MPAPSRRIIDTDSGGRPYAAWLAALVSAMLGLGCYGAMHPLLPPPSEVVSKPVDEVAIADFQLPAAAPDTTTQEVPPEKQPDEPEIEIPPIPEMTPPLTPPEVPELLPVDTPPPPPPPKPAEANSKPVEKPAARPKPARKAATESTGAGGASGSGTEPTLMTGVGSGRFPAPSYPAAARSLRQQGTVRLLITVEASGVATSVEVLSSSGSATLDNAALDQVRRRWRWSSGVVRKYIVPIRFELH